MKREIKFRAWHKGYMALPGKMLYENRPGQCFIWLNEGQPVEIMQFTGLFDPNDAEAYEGDIIERASSTGKGKVRGVIIFEEGQFRVKWKGRGQWNNCLHIHLKESDIIGNIYETPELLTK